MTHIPTPSPFEAPLPSADIASKAALQRSALSNAITPSAAPMEAGKLLGSVSPGIMSILAATGVAIALLGMKTVITAKPPWQK